MEVTTPWYWTHLKRKISESKLENVSCVRYSVFVYCFMCDIKDPAITLSKQIMKFSSVSPPHFQQAPKKGKLLLDLQGAETSVKLPTEF